MGERDNKKILHLAKQEAKIIAKKIWVAYLVEIGQIKHPVSSSMTRIQIPQQKCFSRWKSRPKLMAKFISLTREEKTMQEKGRVKLKEMTLIEIRPTSMTRSSPKVIVMNMKRQTRPRMPVKIAPYWTRSPSHRGIWKRPKKLLSKKLNWIEICPYNSNDPCRRQCLPVLLMLMLKKRVE